ncbi:lipase family protein [Nocardia vinacea]|uniref:lipase family protein n=1 Tax=Nocardia vinacea TaxID=96468 RepID=UPI0002E8DB54|nr:lipase family protein [Nocardia vinacea]
MNSEPMNSEFYDAPTLDGHRAGGLVRTRPVFVPQLTSAAGAWQIIYVSTNSRSELTPASGIVLIPEAVSEPGATAILVYCPEFRGLGGVCAPSQLLAIGAEPATTEIEAALRRGWVVAIPDGEGLGLTGAGPHTFLAARAGGRIVLDLARAVYRGADLGTPVAPVVAWGYADGGRAVTAAGELHPWYAPEVDLRGIAAGAVASDLAALAPAFSQGAGAAVGLAGLIGLSRAYEHIPLRHVLNENGIQAVAEAQHLTGTELLHRFPQPLAHWCRRPDPWNDLWWRRVLALETLAHTKPVMPLHLYHGSADAIVPVHAGRRALIAYRQRGTEVSWREYDAGHLNTASAATGDVLARLGEDITRRPPNTGRVPPDSEHAAHS